MDEYIEQLLAEMPDNQSTLHEVVKNILDEPISDSVKARLLKPLQPGKYRPSPPPRKAKERKRKALEEEFDPIPRHKSLRSAVPKEQYLDDILDFSFDKKEAKTDELVFKQTPWALGNFLRGWQMDVPKGHPQGADPRAFLEDAELLIQKKLEEELKALKGGLKFQLALKVDLEKANPDGSEEYTDPVLRHKQEAVLQKSEIKAALHQAFPRVQETLEKWTQRGSGWAVDQVHTLWLDIARYQPLRGGSYIPLPAAVKNKKAVVNVKNKDDHCLRWALRAALFQVAKDPQRPTKYPTEDGLDFTGIDAPTPISQIPKVEWQNDLAINVFGWDKGVIVHHISDQPEDMPRTNLLLIEKAGKFHYTWIKNLSRLLYDQSKHREKKHFCERCLHGYSREDLLEDHKPECQGIGQTAVRVEMPEEGKNKLAFQNHHKQLPAPYIIYADFEALTTKLAGPELDPTKSNTQKTQQHEACSYSYIVVRCDGQTEKPVEYRGPNAAEHLLRALKDEETKIKGVLANKKAMRMTPEDWQAYNAATICHVCDLPLLRAQHRDATDLYDATSGLYRGLVHRKCAYDDYAQFVELMGGEPAERQSKGMLDIDAAKEQQDCLVCQESLICEQFVDSVRDHCHITGRFRGAAHNACNLKLRLNPKTTTIPVVFHNLRGYDSHLLMQAISKVEGRVSCIPNNTEKYISFSLGQLRFIDSAQFLLASLDKLVSANNPEAFQITARYEPDHQKRTLLMRKGVYPYEFMDSWGCFEETQLPPKEVFYSKLSDEHISDSDYAHAQQVWKTFECRTLGDYTVLYCRTDVLLLADIFENFRKTCQKQYGLDPAHYYTSPGLSWDALLKKTGVSLELITDYDQHLFIEKGMRGGISMVSKRHARANNPAVEGYNPEKPNSHILYLDANNLYGWAMSQPLPTGGFQWVEDCDRLADSVKNLPADGAEGYIFEVDLEYPQGLHDEHNAYPLAPERMVVQKEWMSDYQQELLGVGVAPTEVEKLVPNLRDKERYVLHYRNLQLYLSLGMRVKKVHRALRFEQSPWMEPYIRMNTELRKAATSDFEKDLYKLMNNAVYGKTMENLRRRVNVKLVRSHEEDKLRRLIASPAFARANIFDDDLAAVQIHKSRLVLNRPVYVGMSVLDLSKSLMYDFYYNQMKAQYGDRVELLYTDTDSLLLEIQTEDVYSDMADHPSLYDTSDFPEDHPLHSKVNKKVLGKMKDECAGHPIAEYVGLRPKMYSILEASGVCIKKAKGVKKNVVKKHIRHEQYREALFSKKTFRHGMDVLRSEKHHIYGQHLNKVSLSPFDSKRWIAENGVDTLAYGHKDALPAGMASPYEMDAYIDELLSDVWESHQGAVACQMVPPGAPLGWNLEQDHQAGNTTQAHRAWSLSVRAGTPEETIWRQWLSCAALLPALQADKESEHRRWRGVLPPWGRPVDGGPLKRDFVPLIEPLWHL